MSSEPLLIPPYWKEKRSVKSGRTYYFNLITGESIWEKPVAQFQSLSNWIEVKNKDGLTYYFNVKTNESSWENPKESRLDPKNKDNHISKSIETPGESSSSEEKMNRSGGHFRGNQHFQGQPNNPNHGRGSNSNKNWRSQPYNNTPNRGRWNNQNQRNWSDGNRNPNQFRLNNRHMEFEDLKTQQTTKQNDRFRRCSSVGREIPGMRPKPSGIGNYNQRFSFDREKVPARLPVKSPTRSEETFQSPLMKRLANARGEIIKPTPSSESNKSEELEFCGASPTSSKFTQNTNNNETVPSDTSINSSPEETRKIDNNKAVASNSSGTYSTVSKSIQQKRKLGNNEAVLSDTSGHPSTQQTQKIDINKAVASNSSETSSTETQNIQQKRKLDNNEVVAPKRPRIVISDEDECETSSMSSSTKSSPRSIRSPVVVQIHLPNRGRGRNQVPWNEARGHAHGRGRGRNQITQNQARGQEYSQRNILNQTPLNQGRDWNQTVWSHDQRGGKHQPPRIIRGQPRTPAQNRLLRIQSSLTSPCSSSTPNGHPNTSQQRWFQNDSNFHRQNDSHTLPINQFQNYESRQSEIRSENDFVRPNNIWDNTRLNNAAPRSRSNSQSSSMSVDSGSSPRHRPALPSTPALASTQVQRNQDTMEWEDIPTAVIVETVAEVRLSVTPSKAGFKIPSSSGSPPTPIRQNRSSLIVVLDTNVFLSSMEFVSRARDYMTREYGYPTLFIPWQVVQELDSLKDRSSQTQSLKRRAMESIRFIQTNLRNKHPRIIFQDQDSMEQSQEYLAHECNDDRILASCLQLMPVLDQVGCKSMVLVSEDVNMRNKALINKLNSLSVSELEGVIFQGKAMRNILGPSRPLNEEDMKLEDAFCSLKSKLYDVMSQILIDVLTRKMAPLSWEKGAYHKQPWDWKKLWENYDKHWVSFEEEVVGYNGRNQLNGLRDIILKHERESQVTANILRTFLEEVSSFTRILKHPLLEDLIAEVNEVRQSVISSRVDNSSVNNSRPCDNTVSPTVNQEARSRVNSDRSPSSYRESTPGHVNQEARSRVNSDRSPSIYRESTPGPSTTETSSRTPNNPVPIKQESSGSKSASNVKPNNEPVLRKVFNKIERVFKTIEIFRVAVYCFIDLDPGQITYPDDRLTITETDLKNVFQKYYTCICMLKSCLEDIYEAPSSSLKSNSPPMIHLLNVLNKNDSELLTIEDLVVAFEDQNFYTEIKNGVQQIVNLFRQYRLVYSAIEHFL